MDLVILQLFCLLASGVVGVLCALCVLVICFALCGLFVTRSKVQPWSSRAPRCVGLPREFRRTLAAERHKLVGTPPK